MMAVRKFVVSFFGLILLAILVMFFIGKHNDEASNISNPETTKNNIPKTSVESPKLIKKNYDLYSSTPYDLPLFSILEISKISPSVKSAVDNLLELSQGFYFLKNIDNKILVILQNPVQKCDTFTRHDLQFAEIDSLGNITYHSAGYNGIDGEISAEFIDSKDSWVFDKGIEPSRPLKHVVYDEKGKVKFVEKWSYDDRDPVKYQMKDGKNKLLSILKETQDNDSNLRREHVFYDNQGCIVMSLTINYDGANISRLTFYNSHESVESFSLISEYEDGVRVKELLYSEDYALIKTISAEYDEGDRIQIKSLTPEGIEQEKITIND